MGVGDCSIDDSLFGSDPSMKLFDVMRNCELELHLAVADDFSVRPELFIDAHTTGVFK
jgi:hypothetical protein